MEEVEVKKDEKNDPIAMAVNPPPDRLAQLSVVPLGAVNSFAMEFTIQQIGKDNAFNGHTEMEYYMNKVLELSRSKRGYVLGAIFKLAQTKVEVSADQAAEGRALKF